MIRDEAEKLWGAFYMRPQRCTRLHTFRTDTESAITKQRNNQTKQECETWPSKQYRP